MDSTSEGDGPGDIPVDPASGDSITNSKADTGALTEAVNVYSRGQRLWSLARRAEEAYFTPRSFESERLYRRLGVTTFKKYYPNGGEISVKRGGRSEMSDFGDRELRLRALEIVGRGTEAMHLGFLAIFSVASATLTDSLRSAAIFMGLNTLGNTYGIMVHRYNRIRIHRVLRRIQARSEGTP